MTFFAADPRPARRAMPVLGGLVAAGLLDWAEAADALAAAPAPGTDPSGWQARRNWALADSARRWQVARRRAVWAVRDALAPLLAARAGRAALEQAAARADRDGVLLPRERRALLAAEVARTLNRMKG